MDYKAFWSIFEWEERRVLLNVIKNAYCDECEDDNHSSVLSLYSNIVHIIGWNSNLRLSISQSRRYRFFLRIVAHGVEKWYLRTADINEKLLLQKLVAVISAIADMPSFEEAEELFTGVKNIKEDSDSPLLEKFVKLNFDELDEVLRNYSKNLKKIRKV